MNRFDVAEKIIREVGDFLKMNFGRVTKGTKKSDGTQVSNVDINAEKKYLKFLRKNFPFDGFLTEESKEIKTKNGYRWIIDPLDGTHNFLNKLPIFGSLLALEFNREIIMSFCDFPVFGELFFAQRGRGAYLNNKRINVSKNKTLNGGLFLVGGSVGIQTEAILSDIKSFASCGCKVRLLGSSPFSMACVAKGSALAATARFSVGPWDIAAPALLVCEAGGKLTDIKGEKWSLNSKYLIATNGTVHKKALNLFQKSGNYI